MLSIPFGDEAGSMHGGLPGPRGFPERCRTLWHELTRTHQGNSVLWFCCWMMALSTGERVSPESTDWMKPANWSGNFWGPAASRARSAGELPPLPMTRRWPGGAVGPEDASEGDIVFRLGDARTIRGSFPLSWFIARATGSPFSHTGIVAIEDGSPVVYDCSSDGIQRQTFEVWMLDCVGRSVSSD